MLLFNSAAAATAEDKMLFLATPLILVLMSLLLQLLKLELIAILLYFLSD